MQLWTPIIQSLLQKKVIETRQRFNASVYTYVRLGGLGTGIKRAGELS